MSILDRYGIKEVADVTFYKINKDTGMPERPVLYLDTLKVSTIEQTGEMADARGGKGNPKLITWDYGKEINVTLEDALFSAKSMAIMFGDGSLKDIADFGKDADAKKLIMRTEQFKSNGTDSFTVSTTSGKPVVSYVAGDNPAAWELTTTVAGKEITKFNPRFFEDNGKEITEAGSLDTSKGYFCTYDVQVSGASVIEISADSFPGTYYVTGDTYARSEVSGDDEFFQFIIPKAKVTSENTITLEAEGDPSVFNMNLTVLRPADGIMMKLVKYDMGVEDTHVDETSVIAHNHNLNPSE